MTGARRTSSHLVGRVEAVRVVRRALAQADAGSPTVVVLEGDAGMGRSRLLDAALDATDAWVLALRGWSDGVTPDRAIADALRRSLRAAPGGPDAVVPNAVMGALAGLDTAHAGGADPDRLVGILTDLVARVSGDRLVVVRVDDLGAGDAMVAILSRLHGAIAGGRVAIAVTVPRAAASRGPALRAWLRAMAREPRTAWVELEPLDPSAVEELAAAIIGAPLDAASLATLIARSGGEPLAIEALLADGAEEERPLIALRDPERIPPLLRVDLQDELADLPPDGLAAVTVVALLDRPVDPRLVAAVLLRADGTDESAAMAAIRAALDRRVLVRPAGSDAVRVRRPLVGEVARADLLGPERRRMHAAIAASLEAEPELGPAQPTGAAGEAATHWQRADRPDEALAAAIRAAERAASAGAFPDALRERRRVLALLPLTQGGGPIPPGVELEHLLRAEETATRAGDAAAGVAIVSRALQLVDAAAEPHRVAQLEGDLAYHLWVDGRADDALAAHERAIALVPTRPPSRARARVLRKHAGALLGMGRYRDAVRAASTARDAARAAGAIDEEGRALDMLGMARVGVGQLRAGIAALEAAVILARDHDPGEAHIVGCYNLAYHLLLADRPTEALDWARQGQAAAIASGLAERLGPYLAGVETDALFRAGRLAEASATIARVRRGVVLDARWLYLASVQLRVAVCCGRLEEARATEAEAVLLAAEDVDFDQVAFLGIGRAELAMLEDRDAAALERLRAGAAALAGRDDRFLGPLIGSLRMRALRRLAVAARTHADPAALRAIIAEAAAVDAGDRGTVGLAILADQVEAERAGIEGTAQGATWRGLARRWMALERPVCAADAYLREAEARAHAGAPPRDLREPLQRACDLAVATGAETLRSEAIRLARRWRVKLARIDRHDPVGALLTPDSQMALEPMERSILELLDLGRPIGEVARTTGLPPAEVRAILATLRARAQVASDAALVDAAARLGLVRTTGGATGGEQRADAARTVRTFLFADIAGSTALLEAMGDDAWAGVRAWFDATMRRVFAAHGGHEVDHTGDGFFVAFESGAAAIACAVEMMRTLERHRRTSGFAPAIRLGIHTGETLPGGHGYVGRSVHIAARLLGLAEPGEILASRETVEATGWSAAGPARSVPLKGVSGPVEVVPIRWVRPA